LKAHRRWAFKKQTFGAGNIQNLGLRAKRYMQNIKTQNGVAIL
jgi:hypothetical protein